MAITLVASSSKGGSASTRAFTWSTDLSGITAGDVVIAITHWNGPPGTVSNSDFTSILANREYNGPSAQVDIFYRVITGSESGDTTFSSDNNRHEIHLLAFRGVDTTTIWDVAPTSTTEATGSGSTNTTNSLTTLNDGAMMIALFCNDSNTVSFTGTPSGWNVAFNDSGNQLLLTTYLEKATAGTQSAISATQSTSNGTWLNNIFSLLPASSSTDTNDERTINYKGSVDTNSERTINYKGKVTDNSERLINYKGVDTTNSERTINYKGSVSTNVERTINYKGVAGANDERLINYKGKDTGFDERNLSYTGGENVNNERSISHIGKAITTNERLLNYKGADNTNDERLLNYKGVIGANDERGISYEGLDTSASSERGIIFRGQEYVDFETDYIWVNYKKRAKRISGNYYLTL